ncbi:MAG TPA: signal peptidase II [Candidatus Limnocylindrales bacterium]|jgi:signal peptidase II|nr:signal peptidase II [Candidatus Limnocylindrales bacterium]
MSATATQRRWLAFAGLAALVVAADQLTKAWVHANLVPGRPPVEVVGDLVRFVYGQNRGGIFGLFGDSATLLGLASTFVIALIVVYMAREGTRSHWLLTVALGLLLGGAIGNLIDRLRLAYVIDWVDMGIGEMRWYTFNVADAAISGALLLLIVITLLGERLASASEPAEQAQA